MPYISIFGGVCILMFRRLSVSSQEIELRGRRASTPERRVSDFSVK